MLSIIVCSKNEELKSIFLDNIDKTIGIEYEIIYRFLICTLFSVCYKNRNFAF
jgi:hypothetical protein